MRPRFYDTSVFQDQNSVGMANRGEPVCDENGGFAFDDVGQIVVNEFFRFGINGAGGFVKNHNRGIFENSPRNAEPLTLTTGKANTTLTDKGVITLG